MKPGAAVGIDDTAASMMLNRAGRSSRVSTMNTTPTHKPTLGTDLLLVVLLVFLFLPGIFLKDFWLFNEGRRAIIAMEMLRGGDWLVPHLMGLPILTKPPLFYWLEGLCYILTGGPSDWAARLPSVFAAVACVLGLAWMMRRLFDKSTGLMTALMLAPMPVFVGMAQSAEPEMLFVGTGVLGLACFVQFLAGGEDRRRWLLLFYTMMMLSFMAQGPLMLLVVVLTAVTFYALMGRARILRELFSWTGLAILVAPVVLLIALVQMRTSVIAAVLQEAGSHLQDDAPHSKGFLFYLDTLHKLAFPWAFWIYGAGLFALGRAWWRGRTWRAPWTRLWHYLSGGDGERLLVFLWFVITVLVFSVIPSKRYYYGLAFAPPVAALAAMLLRDWVASGMPLFSRLIERFRPWTAVGAFLLAILMSVLGLLASVPKIWQEYDGKSTLDDKTLLCLAGVWFVGIAAIVWRHAGGGNGARVFRAIMLWLAILMAGLVTCYNFAVTPEINKSLSLKRASLEIAPLVAGAKDLFSYRSTHTVCFYLGRYDLKTVNNIKNLDRYLNENPGALCITYKKYMDDLDEAGIKYDTLYRSDYIPEKDYRVYLLRIHWPRG